ncbi:MAG: hypothetical protein PHH60_03910, partial [Candidatus Margulisbacteria bacterium]|nr:hypothetical protein [Candidatus Margulisiibacteriota bacterium]
MNRKFPCYCALILMLCCPAFADLRLTLPQIAKSYSKILEVGSSPTIYVQYKNMTGQDIDLDRAEINLIYYPDVIDGIIEIANLNPSNLVETERDDSQPGIIIYKLGALQNNNAKPLKVPAGQAVYLASLTCHLDQKQKLEGKKSLSLFHWTENNPSAVYSGQTDVTGKLIDPSKITLERPEPPSFSGLKTVASVNTLGISNPGNTLVLDWKTSAGADRT